MNDMRYARQPAALADGRNGYNLGKLKVLIVDDNVFCRRIARSVLNSLGVRSTFEASSVAAGLDAIPTFWPDLILSDWVTGPDDGLSFVSHVRASSSPSARFVPIILVSSYSEIWRVNLARDAGVNEYVVKPYNANTLYAKIRTILESQRNFIEVPNGYFGPDRRRRALRVAEDRRSAHDQFAPLSVPPESAAQGGQVLASL